jgi:hypothetical protein
MATENGERLVVRLYNGPTCCMAADVTQMPFDVVEQWWSEMVDRGYRVECKRVPVGRSITGEDEDPLAAAKGGVNGMVLGAILWGVILCTCSALS